MAFPFKDEMFHAQWLRTAGHAYAGGADLGECIATAEAVRERDVEGWCAAWSQLAQRLMSEGERSLAAGHAISAHAAFLRASNYFRAAYVFLLTADRDPRLLALYRAHRDAFRRALATRPGMGEAIVIPFQGIALAGYFFAAAGPGPHPTLVITGGYDSTAEEAWLYSGAAAVARGYNVVCYDGPGQGQAIIEDRIPFRPDWEVIVAAVLAAIQARPEVDPDRIALMGISFGGYLAPRAASGNPGLAALIADPGQYSLFEEMKSRMPGFIGRQLPDGNRLILALLRRIMNRRRRHPTGGWALRRAELVHGVATPLDYMRLTADYNSIGHAGRIGCPTLISTAESDDIGVTARQLFDALACPKTFLTFTNAEGAGGHCEAGARSLYNQRVFDWLDETLPRRTAGRSLKRAA